MKLLWKTSFLLGLLVAALPLFGAAENDEGEEPGAFANMLQSAAVPFYATLEFFDTTLPGTLDRYSLALEFRPRLGDLPNRGFIRYPFVLRYGFSDNLELGTRFTPVSPNPFRSKEDRKWSMGEIAPFFRVDVPPVLRIWTDATLEVRLRQPLGRPPVDLIDGYTRLQPRLSLARPVPAYENTLLYLNLYYDYALGAWGRAKPSPMQVTRRDIAEVTPGLLYKPGSLGYFGQYTLRHIDEPLEHRIAHVYRVGFLWTVQEKYAERVRLPGRWQIEMGYELTDEQRRSLAHSIALRVRWRGDLKAVFSRGESEARD